MSTLELFSGIGGFAAAVGCRASVTAAVDINRKALEVYRANFGHPVAALNIEGLTPDHVRGWNADLWWLSPPCQPFTRRGRGRDLEDPRARGLERVLHLLEEAPPIYLVLENVPGFVGSGAHGRLRRVLDRGGFDVREQLFCPTDLGIPNRRRRFYLVAGRRPLARPAALRVRRRRLTEFLEQEPPAALWLDGDLKARYRWAVDVADPEDPEAVAACFTSAYGRSPVRSGSYLRTPDGLRRFSPDEILRLLGYPESFTLPAAISRSLAWRLVGNSLSVPAVRWVLEAIPELASLSAGPASRAGRPGPAAGSRTAPAAAGTRAPADAVRSGR